MKIRDLDLDQYVIVYDMGKSENNEGITVVGRVDEIIFNEDDKNEAGIDSLGNFYRFDDSNYFDLWTNYIESKTESVSEAKRPSNASKWIEKAIEDSEEYINKVKSNDFELWSKQIEDKTESVSESFNSRLRKNIEAQNEYLKSLVKTKQSNDLQQRKRNDTVNHPSHYNYGEIEVIDFIEQVTRHYNANVAYHIGNAIKYLARSPHKNGKEDIDKARWYIERAFENWDVK